MTERVGVKELRDTLTFMLRRVRHGETLEITHHGVPVAILAPIPPDPGQRLIAEGAATPPVALDRPIRRRPSSTGVTASKALQDDRGRDSRGPAQAMPASR